MRSGSIIALIGAIVLFLLLFGLFGGGMMGWGVMGPMHMWRWDDSGFGSWWGFGMMLAMGLLSLLFIMAIVLGIVWIVRSASADGGERRDGSGGDRSLEILRERYARGEITKEEFDQIRQDLE